MTNISKRKSKMSRFWLVYAIVTSVLVIAVFAGLVLFYDFMDAFEESQPQSPAEAAKAYAESLTEDDVRSLIELEASKLLWSSEEARNGTINTYMDAFKAGGIFCRRNGGEDDSPIYSVIADRREICRITLKKSPIGRYSFDAWSVTDTFVSFDGFMKYSVKVPEGSTVMLNGAPMSESYVSDKNLPYSTLDVEKGAKGLPTAKVYETELLDKKPEVSVRLGDTELEVSYSDGVFTANYPDSLLYSATVKVPAGATVTVRGNDLASTIAKTSESAFGGLIAEGLVVPSFDVYEIDGLYCPLADVSVTLNGEELTFEDTVDGTVQSISVDIGSVTNDSVSTFADSFIRAYFHYTSSGYRNTAENLAAALAYVQNGTELYTRIRDSKVGYDFVTPVTSQVYNRLEVTRMYRLEDSSYVVSVAFDVDHQIYSESRSYKGDIFLHIVDAGGYKIANMVIENE